MAGNDKKGGFTFDRNDSIDLPLFPKEDSDEFDDGPLFDTPMRSESFYRFPLVSSQNMDGELEAAIRDLGLSFPRNFTDFDDNLPLIPEFHPEFLPGLYERSPNFKSKAHSQASTISCVPTQDPTISPELSQNSKLDPLLESYSQPLNIEPPMMEAWGVLVSLNSSSRLILSTGQDEYIVGRLSPSDFIIDRPQVSSQHFRISRVPEGGDWFYLITDLGSTNGTYLNDTRLKPKTPTKLRLGDLLYLRSRKSNRNVDITDMTFVFVDRFTPKEGIEKTYVFAPGISLPSNSGTQLDIGVHRVTLRKYLVQRVKPSLSTERKNEVVDKLQTHFHEIKRLSSPSLGRTIALDGEGGEKCIIFEEGQHGGMDTYLKWDMILPETTAQTLILQIARALFYLHEQGKAHGNLTMASLRRTSPIGSIIVVGRVENGSARMDIIQLGLIALQMLSGSPVHLELDCLKLEPNKPLAPEDKALIARKITTASPEAIDFVARLLFTSGSFKPLLHPWLTDCMKSLDSESRPSSQLTKPGPTNGTSTKKGFPFFPTKSTPKPPSPSHPREVDGSHPPSKRHSDLENHQNVNCSSPKRLLRKISGKVSEAVSTLTSRHNPSTDDRKPPPPSNSNSTSQLR